MKIAVDAMGGDNAPQAIIDGVLSALKEIKEEIVLVGDKEKISPFLKKASSKIPIYQASEVVEMDESPSFAIRKKKDSSIVKAIDLLKDGEVDAVVTAGNTGAYVAAATINLKLIPGIDRAALASPLPTTKGVSLLLDVGATVDSSAENLFQFAIMGSIYSKKIMEKENPTVGLINIGEESSKGNYIVKKAYEIIKASNLNFIGNIEGRDIFSGDIDVIVCDGFVGNILLKSIEGFTETLQVLLKQEIDKRISSKFGAFLVKDAYKAFKNKLDYASYGGVPLLGTGGYCIKAHGASSSNAIKNSILVAEKEVKTGVNKEIQKYFESNHVTERTQV
ncbi:MAG: phosphate acyltransferase PlsX [Candidatus Ratteibacteria bacterium]|nr:phosphate acyltransferase PlsX [Candidatus Ratteibacteria bacterium]